MKKKENENQNLLSIIKNKENENMMLQNKLDSTSPYFELGENSGNNFGKFNEEIQEKNKIIENLENEINNLKKINNKLENENKELQKKIQMMKNEEGKKPLEERISITLDNLKEELKDKNLQIEKLIKENNNIKNNLKKSNIILNDADDKIIDSNNNKDGNNPFFSAVNSGNLNDEEKTKMYKDQIKDMKLMNESDMIQIKTLKAEIKEMKEKIKKFETFSGQLKNYGEYISLLNKALYDYRPKKKEQKEALNKLIDVMNNHHI